MDLTDAGLRERACKKCGATKLLAEFAKSKLCDLGYRHTCKACVAEVNRAYDKTPDGRRRAREKRKRYLDNGGRGVYNAGTVRRRKRRGYPVDPVKRHARSVAHRAIWRGTLQRQSCETCGAEKAQAHHDDYTRPLDVRWLCGPCHRRVHGVLV